MSIAVVSYSLTGNNDALACGVARQLAAEHIQVTEAKPRSTGVILLDMIFNRTPRVETQVSALEKFDRVLFIAPVWMGQAASPLRAYFRHMKEHPRKYAYACISGGALNPNPKLTDDLMKRTGTAPAAVVDLHIVDLLPADPKPTAKDTSAYRLNDADKAKLTEAIVKAVKGVL